MRSSDITILKNLCRIRLLKIYKKFGYKKLVLDTEAKRSSTPIAIELRRSIILTSVEKEPEVKKIGRS